MRFKARAHERVLGIMPLPACMKNFKDRPRSLEAVPPCPAGRSFSPQRKHRNPFVSLASFILHGIVQVALFGMRFRDEKAVGKKKVGK